MAGGGERGAPVSCTKREKDFSHTFIINRQTERERKEKKKKKKSEKRNKKTQDQYKI